MAPIAKLFPKFDLATSMTINYGLGQKSNTCQNPVNVNTANSINPLHFILDNRGIKIKIIITISNTDIL